LEEFKLPVYQKCNNTFRYKI